MNNELAKDKLDIVINDDCLKYMQSLPNNCIDCILTSPPYNFGIDYGNYYSDHNTWDSYFNMMNEIIEEMYRILTTGGRVVFNIQPFFSDYIPSHHVLSHIFLRHKFIWRNEILWEKNNYTARYTSWGSWKSPSSPYLKYTHEFIEVYCKETIKHNNRRNEKPDITDEEFKSSVIGKWSIAPERNMKKYNHNAMFPEKLVEKALKIFTFPNDVVLDPFGGVGTTALVCKRINRRYISIDVSKEYCKTAIQRIEDEPNKLFFL
jgi:DNA modification methylase